MAQPDSTSKETVYVDIDDEITNIVDKVKGSQHKIVALVLPKRATVLQSIVNMKLLKRAAEQSKKNIVLITSEAGLLPLAGAVGLYVAKTLQSKPAIPPIPDRGDSGEVSEIDEDDPQPDRNAPVGALAAGAAGAAAVGALAGSESASAASMAGAAGAASAADDDVIELDNVNMNVDSSNPAKQGRFGRNKAAKGAKPKRTKVPNFDRFRVLLVAGIALLILLIVGWYFSFVVWPHANVVIKTDSAAITTTVKFTASTSAKTVDTKTSTIPAVYKEVKKTDTAKVTATGKKDNGTKATGTMTLTNCINDGQPHTVPAGTQFTSGNLVFLSDEAVDLEAALFSGSSCKSANFGLSKNVGVTAAQAGGQYNLSSRSYNSSITGITAGGSAMSGGTSNVVVVVQQSDIDGAKTSMKGKQDDAAKTDLRTQVDKDGYFPLMDTLVISDPVIKQTAAVGDEATDVTVTAETTYSVLGVKQSDLSTLVKSSVDGQIDKSKQVILDDGVVAASFTVVTRKSPQIADMSMQAVATAGPQLDGKAIANDIKGMKKGDAQKLILARPGIKDVTISYSPFWVLSTPKAAKKITVTFEKPEKKTTTQSTNNATSANP